MSKVIIGIHGMGNKPPPKTLSCWWKASVCEGLKRIKKSKPAFDFELVYWAHHLHPAPLKPRIKDKKHRNEKVMLIAHSLGSFIAYDVLTLDASNVPIDTFVTIGSPLGLPIIKNRIVAEVKQNPSQKTILKTPENIRSHWYNLADLRDKISINDTLQDEFKENAIHIGPVDKIVTNDYAFDDQKKTHKSHGYLRTTKMAEIIDGFISGTH